MAEGRKETSWSEIFVISRTLSVIPDLPALSKVEGIGNPGSLLPNCIPDLAGIWLAFLLDLICDSSSSPRMTK